MIFHAKINHLCKFPLFDMACCNHSRGQEQRVLGWVASELGLLPRVTVAGVVIFICGHWCRKQVSQAGISNCIPQYSVGCSYLSLSEIFDFAVLFFYQFAMEVYTRIPSLQIWQSAKLDRLFRQTRIIASSSRHLRCIFQERVSFHRTAHNQPGIPNSWMPEFARRMIFLRI